MKLKNIAAKYFLLFFFLVYDLSGFRWLFNKVGGSPKGKEPSTLIVWLLGFYLATYSFSVTLYETRKSSLERRINSLSLQIQSGDKAAALSRIAGLQKNEIPVQPVFFKSDDIFHSLASPFVALYKREASKEIIQDIKEIIEAQKHHLAGVNLEGIDLSQTDLTRAKLDGSNLIGANLREANLSNSTAIGANFSAANLTNANITKANFSGAVLNLADMSGIHASFSNLRGAQFYKTASSRSSDWVGAKFDINSITNVGSDHTVIFGCFSEPHVGVGSYSEDSLFRYCSFPALEFQLDSTVVDAPRHSLTLNRATALLTAWPNARLRLTGHTHSIGSAEYNQRLGAAMANSLKSYLVDRGIRPSQLETLSRGEWQPLSSTQSGIGHVKNNRVEMVILK